MDILFLAPALPYPPIYGGAIRTWNLLANVAREHAVHLLCLTKTPLAEEHLEQVRRVCAKAEVVWHQPEEDPPLLDRRPRTVREHSSDEFRRRLRELIANDAYDVIHMECAQMGAYLSETRGCPVLLDLHDVLSRVFLRRARVARGPWSRLTAWWEYLKMVGWEPPLLERAHCVVTVSEEERQLALSFAPQANVHVIENGADLERFPFTRECRDPDLILFLGYMAHSPNVDALTYFYETIFPILRARRPSVRLQVVGARAETELPAQAPDVTRRMREDPSVELVGTVPDAVPYLTRAGVLVVPLRVAGGTRVRLLEAMAAGIPIVSTSIGAEGLPVADGQELRVADRPEAFAQAVAEVLEDASASGRFVARARRLVEERYDWKAMAERLCALYESLASGKVKAA